MKKNKKGGKKWQCTCLSEKRVASGTAKSLVAVEGVHVVTVVQTAVSHPVVVDVVVAAAAAIVGIIMTAVRLETLIGKSGRRPRVERGATAAETVAALGRSGEHVGRRTGGRVLLAGLRTHRPAQRRSAILSDW